MIAQWMLAATAFGVLAAAAAFTAERALRLLGRQGRAVWILALVLTCAWPVLAPALLRMPQSTVAIRALPGGVVIGAAEAVAAVAAWPSWRDLLAATDRPLLVLWGVASLFLLLRAGTAVSVLRRLARNSDARTVDGHPVLIAPRVGPAAFGVVHRRIVLPRWALDLDGSLRRLVMQHELEHVRAADPAVLAAAWMLAVAMPWNAAVWIIVRRLRTATELDCDVRVMRGGADIRQYAQLLLLIAQRQQQTAFAAMIAGSPSTLHERIIAMHRSTPSHPVLRALLLAGLAAIFSGIAATPALARELARVRELLPTPLVAELQLPAVAPAPPQAPVAAPAPASPLTPATRKTPAFPRAAASMPSAPPPLTAAAPSTPPPAASAPAAPAPTDAPAPPSASGAPAVPAAQPPSAASLHSAPPPPAIASAPSAPPPPAAPPQDTAKKAKAGYVEFKLDEQANLVPGTPGPRYPPALKEAGVSGSAIVQVVVDTSGRVMEGSLKVVRASHEAFALAVRDAAAGLKFSPARVGDHRVRQLVQLVYHFRNQGKEAAETPLPASSVRTIEVIIDVRK